MTALIVDDDIRNIFAMTTVLERGRLTVVAAESGAEAIEILVSRPEIDIVLMDIMMPIMDGYATMRAIRQLPCGRRIPILAVTAKAASSAERKRCLDAGASAYISKPVDATELLRVLEQSLASRQTCPPRRQGDPDDRRHPHRDARRHAGIPGRS